MYHQSALASQGGSSCSFNEHLRFLFIPGEVPEDLKLQMLLLYSWSGMIQWYFIVTCTDVQWNVLFVCNPVKLYSRSHLGSTKVSPHFGTYNVTKVYQLVLSTTCRCTWQLNPAPTGPPFVLGAPPLGPPSFSVRSWVISQVTTGWEPYGDKEITEENSRDKTKTNQLVFSWYAYPCISSLI